MQQVLEEESIRALAVLDPILLTISNWPEGKVEEFETEVLLSFISFAFISFESLIS